jgi:hypothetical protein
MSILTPRSIYVYKDFILIKHKTVQDNKPIEQIPLSGFKYLGYLTITDCERIWKREGVHCEYKWNPLLSRKENALQKYLLEIILAAV